MKLKYIFTITAIVDIIFGLLLIILPAQIFSLYAIESNPGVDYVAQLLGTALISIGMICWLLRNSPYTDTQAAIILSLFISCGIGAIVALHGQLNNVLNNFGWLTVGICISLFVVFGYFYFTKRKSSVK